MSRYDELRAMREAHFEAAESKQARLEHAREALKQAEGVTKKTAPVTKTSVDGVTKTPTVTKAKRGRPRLGDKPMTAAERMRRYRASKAPLP